MLGTKYTTFDVSEDTEVYAGVLLHSANEGEGSKIISLLLRPVWSGIAKTNTKLGLCAYSESSYKQNNNTAIGYKALNDLECGNKNTALGSYSGNDAEGGHKNTFLGYRAGVRCGNEYCNSTAIGANSRITCNNQVKAGDCNTKLVCHEFYNISDERDKTDVLDTVLGLDFIKSLHPVDYKTDFRESYTTEPPAVPEDNATPQALQQYTNDLSAWQQSNLLANIVPDGTHKSSIWHHGFLAQEVWGSWCFWWSL